MRALGTGHHCIGPMPNSVLTESGGAPTHRNTWIVRVITMPPIIERFPSCASNPTKHDKVTSIRDMIVLANEWPDTSRREARDIAIVQ